MRGAAVRRSALVALIIVAAAVAGGGAYLVTRVVRTPAAAPSPSVSPPSAYAAAGASPSGAPSSSSGSAPVPRAAAVAARLGAALNAPGLGGRLGIRVVDVASGATLFDRNGTTAAAPASTAKLVTAAAVLGTHKPTERITTSVRSPGGGTIVLVGNGDPTLTGAAAGRPGRYPQAARISDLAAQIRRAHVTVTKIVVDGSRFSGPAVSPDWAPEDVPSEYASAITAVMADGGRAEPDATVRSETPDLDAGHELASALGQASLPVERGDPSGGRTVASVRSAPIGTLVQQMLTDSDDVIAECLARQVAVSKHVSASFSGAAAAVRTVVRGLGADPGGGMRDGSGLSPDDRVSPAALGSLLRIVARDGGPDGVLRAIVAGLPVAGWSGTLADRYLSGSQRGAEGVVRAKTGTLTGVSALAGLVHDRSGRLLAFALIADRTSSTAAAEAALDALAARLAGCGCS